MPPDANTIRDTAADIMKKRREAGIGNKKDFLGRLDELIRAKEVN